MKVYFVRHGESESNKAITQSLPDEKLSKEGLEQAHLLAQRFKTIPISLLIASPYTRTQQTAESIAHIKQCTIQTSDLIKEFRWPTVFAGKNKKDPEVHAVRQKIEESWETNPTWRHSDEETFFEIRKRAADFLEYLKTLKTDSDVAVVSHARFLKVLLAVMIHGSQADGKIVTDLFYRISLTNTGITVAQLHNDSWNLLTINDHAHLGEYSRQVY